MVLGVYGCCVAGLRLCLRRVSNAFNLLVQRFRAHGQRVRNAHAAELPHKREEEHAGQQTLGVYGCILGVDTPGQEARVAGVGEAPGAPEEC